VLLKPSLEINFQPEGQKAGREVTDRRVVAMMKDRPSLQGAFRFPKRPLHTPQALIRLRHLGGGKIGVRPQNES
jgi:hypothetical protein